MQHSGYIHTKAPSDDSVMIRLADAGEDVELQAIAYITSVLSRLQEDARGRVLAYLLSRFSPQQSNGAQQ